MGTRITRKPDGKLNKPPYRVRRDKPIVSGSKTNPDHRAGFDEASEALRNDKIDAIGYVFTAEDPYTVIDLDNCRNPETGEIESWAREAVEALPSYWEISLSGTGLHGIAVAEKNTERCRSGKFEVYDGATGARFMVITGDRLEGTPAEIRKCQAEVDTLLEKHLPTREAEPPPPPSKPVDLPDEELLQKAASSKYGAEFQALFSGDTSVTGGDHSRADYRLMRALLFWTGGDETRARSLFGRSGLARRKKWGRADYRNRTIHKARMSLTSYYDGDADTGKNAQLEKAVSDLWSRWWSFDWTGLVGTGTRPHSMRGTTCRDVMKVLLDAAGRHGSINSAGEVRVSIGRRTIALRAATGLKAVNRAVKHLEAEGWLEFEPPESENKPGTYTLRATRPQYLSTHTTGKENVIEDVRAVGGGVNLRAPRLRWSYPGRKARRGVVKGTGRVREGVPSEPRDPIKRLGKIRGAVLDLLDAAGGRLPLEELYAQLHPDRSPDDRKRWRPRDLKRRALPMLEEEGIITVGGDTVALTEDWADRLEFARGLGGEIASERVDKERYAKQREAFRRRHETKADDAPTDEDLAAQREAFKAALAAKRRAEEIEVRDNALAAFRAFETGAKKNLALMMDGELRNVEYLVNSVLAYHHKHPTRWKRLFEKWKGPVLEAAAIVAREHAPPPTPADDWRDHALDCECAGCTTPAPRYARSYRGSGAA